MDDLRDQLAANLARAAGEEWPPVTGDVVAAAYHWYGEADAVLPVVAADRAQLAERIENLAAGVHLEARRHAIGSPQRISLIAQMGAYRWAARLIRGDV